MGSVLINLKTILDNYEIGGIGDIKKSTLRFHSYRIGTEDGKLTIYAEYDPNKPPKVFKGYPAGQELLISLCNLNLELRDKPQQECARILIRWSLENIHISYAFGDGVAKLEYTQDSPEDYWDAMVNVLECYYVHVVETVERLEKLYTDTMTVFALHYLIEGQVADAQRIYENVRISEKENLMIKWYRTEQKRRDFLIQEYLDRISKLSMELEYNLASGQVQLQPVVKSVIDAAYFGLARFIAVNANALDDYGGKTSIAFCQACGKAFIKNGNRQKYCGTLECQSVRNKIKSEDYYYRKRNETLK